MGAKARRSRVVRVDGEGRLSVSVDDRNNNGAVISAVPQGRRNYLRGYVWIGDDGRCFGWMPTTRLLALADAIRAEATP